MRNRTEHGFSRLTAISDAGSTPAASTSLREAKAVAPKPWRRRTNSLPAYRPFPKQRVRDAKLDLWSGDLPCLM